MTANTAVEAALERWQSARAHLSSFEADYLTLLLVSVESERPLAPPPLEDSILAAWREAEAEAHAAYTALLNSLN